MEEKGSNEIVHDEFECAECDYKSYSETEGIVHREMHRVKGDHIADTTNSICIPDNGGNNYVHTDHALLNIKSECFGRKESEALIMSTTIHGIQNNYINRDAKCYLERDLNYYENKSPDTEKQKTRSENKKIKLEEIDIDHNLELYVQPGIITDHENIKQESYQFDSTLPTIKNEKASINDNIQTYCNNTMFSREDNSETTKSNQCCGSLSIANSQFHQDSHIKNKKYKSHNNKELMEVVNTNVYFPEEWQRKLYTYDPVPKSYSLKKKNLLKRRVSKIPGVEVDIDNSGKYIPVGWQRKIYQDHNNRYILIYISPTGTKLSGKSSVSNHIKYLDKHGIKSSVDIDQMDFSISSHNLPKRRKRLSRVEIEVDNTNVYIPEGWKRTAFEYLRGSKINYICYISPLDNRIIFSTCKMKKYLAELESKGHSLAVDIGRLNFSRKSITLQKKEPKKLKDLRFDHTGNDFFNGLEDINFDKKIKSCFPPDIRTNIENKKQIAYPLNLASPAPEKDVRYQLPRIDYLKPLKGRVPQIPGIEIEIDNTGKYIPEGWQRKVFQVTEGTQIGRYRVSYISPFGNFFNGKKHVSSHIKHLKKYGINFHVDIAQMDFTIASHNLPTRIEGFTRVEIEVDNNDVYIPEGWKRTAFEYLDGAMKQKLCYISPFNREVFSCSDMKQYLQQLEGRFLDVDIEKLSFSFKSPILEKKEPKKQGEDVEVDNTGKYIPAEWQRKVYRNTEGSTKGKNKILFISPTGHRLQGKAHVLKHIKYLEERGIRCTVDVEQMDFTLASHNLSNKRKIINKVEIEIDNTQAYIPEGWERKAYMYSEGPMKGKRRVFYISPYNKQVDSRGNMNKYLIYMKKEGCHLSVDKKRLNFSTKDIV